MTDLRGFPDVSAPIGMYPENSRTTEDSHMLQTTPHTTAGTDKIEGPNPIGTENWCCLQDPLRNVPKGIHWTDKQDPEAPPHKTQKSPEIR